jgi:outer membrane receptor protein involved in Fe transport
MSPRLRLAYSPRPGLRVTQPSYLRFAARFNPITSRPSILQLGSTLTATIGRGRRGSTEIFWTSVKSVQTLKGPQGTLFGRNTTGGAILIQTNDPDFKGVHGVVSGSYGRFNYGSESAIVNLPLIDDKLAMRAAYEHLAADGYAYDPNNNVHPGNHDRWTARLKLLYKPTDSLSVLLSAEQFQSRNIIPLRIGYISPGSPENLDVALQTGTPVATCFANRAACSGTGYQLLSKNVQLSSNSDVIPAPRGFVPFEEVKT